VNGLGQAVYASLVYIIQLCTTKSVLYKILYPCKVSVYVLLTKFRRELFSLYHLKWHSVFDDSVFDDSPEFEKYNPDDPMWTKKIYDTENEAFKGNNL